MLAAVSFRDLGDDLVTARSGRTAAEQFGQFQILTLCAFLAAADGEFGVTRRYTRLVHGEFFRGEKLDHIDERPPCADRRELAWIAHEDDPVNAAQGIKQRGELVLGEHRRFIDDHRLAA
jgi:hypothetical protein